MCTACTRKNDDVDLEPLAGIETLDGGVPRKEVLLVLVRAADLHAGAFDSATTEAIVDLLHDVADRRAALNGDGDGGGDGQFPPPAFARVSPFVALLATVLNILGQHHMALLLFQVATGLADINMRVNCRTDTVWFHTQAGNICLPVLIAPVLFALLARFSADDVVQFREDDDAADAPLFNDSLTDYFADVAINGIVQNAHPLSRTEEYSGAVRDADLPPKTTHRPRVISVTSAVYRAKAEAAGQRNAMKEPFVPAGRHGRWCFSTFYLFIFVGRCFCCLNPAGCFHKKICRQ
jgi:hypothetical protein